MTATTIQTGLPVLQPCYGFEDRDQAQAYLDSTGRKCDLGRSDRKIYLPIPGACAGYREPFDLLVMMDGRGKPFNVPLRTSEQTMPTGAYNVLELRGGRYTYHRSVRRSSKHPAWWYRLADGPRDCYVVWGRADGQFYLPSRAARTRSARGAIYSRWPIYTHDGQLSRYEWQLAHIELSILDRKPALGDALRISVGHMAGWTPEDEGERHWLYLEPYDPHWRELIGRARQGFDEYCSARPDPATETWRVWFLKQRAADMADRLQDGGFHDTCKQVGWLAALDSAREAWQLAAALEAHRHLFPQVAPDPDVPLDPGYDGTIGSMEGRLLGTYLEFRPDRSEEFHRWMSGYVSVASNLRSFTGD